MIRFQARIQMDKMHDSSPQSPRSRPNAQPFVVRIPDAQLYWSVLDLSPLGLSRWQTAQQQQLLNLIDAELPLPVEDVQVATLRVDQLTVVACGIERKALDALVQEAPDAHVAVPASVPEWLLQEIGDPRHINPDSLNLLQGDYEPNVVRRVRRVMHLHAVAALILIAFVVLAGLERRRMASLDALSAIEIARQAVYERALRASPAGVSGTQPLAARFTSELRRLQQTRGSFAHQDGFRASDAESLDDTLHALIATWPNEHHMQTESITMSGRTLTIIGTLPSALDAEHFARTVGSFAPGQWESRQPAIQSAERDENVRLTLRLERVTRSVGETGS